VKTPAKTFLMFQGQCEEAFNHWARVIPNSQVLEIRCHGPETPGSEGKVLGAEMSLAGQVVMGFDSPVEHAFGFTPRISFFLECEDEAEIDAVYAALLDGGEALMPIDNYGFSRRFGWVNDKFGISWQMTLA
jgi:predicted 3-demethylubiquinone-9 3-methyltransferase (glyoxalase superfamily)